MKKETWPLYITCTMLRLTLKKIQLKLFPSAIKKKNPLKHLILSCLNCTQ